LPGKKLIFLKLSFYLFELKKQNTKNNIVISQFLVACSVKVEGKDRPDPAAKANFVNILLEKLQLLSADEGILRRTSQPSDLPLCTTSVNPDTLAFYLEDQDMFVPTGRNFTVWRFHLEIRTQKPRRKVLFTLTTWGKKSNHQFTVYHDGITSPSLIGHLHGVPAGTSIGTVQHFINTKQLPFITTIKRITYRKRGLTGSYLGIMVDKSCVNLARRELMNRLGGGDHNDSKSWLIYCPLSSCPNPKEELQVFQRTSHMEQFFSSFSLDMRFPKLLQVTPTMSQLDTSLVDSVGATLPTNQLLMQLLRKACLGVVLDVFQDWKGRLTIIGSSNFPKERAVEFVLKYSEEYFEDPFFDDPKVRKYISTLEKKFSEWGPSDASNVNQGNCRSVLNAEAIPFTPKSGSASDTSSTSSLTQEDLHTHFHTVEGEADKKKQLTETPEMSWEQIQTLIRWTWRG